MHFHVPLALEVDRLRLVEIETILQATPGDAIHLNHAGHAFRGDAAGDVDRVAPKVVDEFLFADHAGDHRAGADADAHFQVGFVDDEIAAQQLTHGQGHVGDGVGIVCLFVVEAARHHVGVPDGLDLLQAETLGHLVERREDPVQHGEHLGRRHAAGDLGEVDDVGEHHRHVGEAVGNGLVAVLQPLRHRTGKDVEQQALGALLLDLQQMVGFRQTGLRLLLFDGGETQQQKHDGRDRSEIQGEEDDRRLDGDLLLRLDFHRGQVKIEETRHRQQE